jgi:hypothetical protein
MTSTQTADKDLTLLLVGAKRTLEQIREHRLELNLGPNNKPAPLSTSFDPRPREGSDPAAAQLRTIAEFVSGYAADPWIGLFAREGTLNVEV